MRHVIASFLVITLAGCAAPAFTAAPRTGAPAARAADVPPAISAILGDGHAAPTFATWLGRKIKLSVAATGNKGLKYKWTSTGTLEGRTDGPEAVFVGAEWGDFTATVEIADAKGRSAAKTVRIAVWPGAGE